MARYLAWHRGRRGEVTGRLGQGGDGIEQAAHPVLRQEYGLGTPAHCAHEFFGQGRLGEMGVKMQVAGAGHEGPTIGVVGPAHLTGAAPACSAPHACCQVVSPGLETDPTPRSPSQRPLLNNTSLVSSSSRSLAR